MAARSIVFSVNGMDGQHENFAMPNVRPDDLVGAPMFPGREFFQRPDDLEPGQKMLPRLNPDDPMFGQFFGYVAPKGQCLLDVDPNECWIVPPSPSNYEWAHQGTTLLSDGTELKTANVGGGAGHAAIDLGWRQVPLFYENTSYQGASVRFGEDGYGIYGVGVLVPEMTWGRALQMVRAATSGDWRWVDELQAWDFMGACCVNNPGFPFSDGAKVVQRASATVLDRDRAMLITFSGAPYERTEPDMSGAAGCSCQTPKVAAGGEPITVDINASSDMVETIQGMIDSAVTAAIASNNEAWESKIAEQFGAINGRLDVVEPIALTMLDRVDI